MFVSHPIDEPDHHQNLADCSLGQFPTLLKIQFKSAQNFLSYPADTQKVLQVELTKEN